MNYSELSVLKGKRVAILTLGCKVNSYESDAIAEQFRAQGADIVEFDEACQKTDYADVFVLNTCSVTNIADRKSRQMLHRARHNNPNAMIAATGCYAQIGGEKLIADSDADIVVGNSHKSELVGLVANLFYQRYLSSSEGDIRGSICLVDSMTHEKHYEEMRICSCEERTRAFIKIEDGCNQFCSYCIIPYARGRVRSRSIESIVEEVGALADKGYKEVVLTGIHVSSYGFEDYERPANSAEQEGFTSFRHEPLLKLIKAVAGVEGIERIRLGSLEPRIITYEFAHELSAIDKFCPYFHLSLQSGCDSVLKRMHRHYTAEEYLMGCEILRKVFDRPSINTDVIVGFPGESEDEFEMSRSFLEKVNFAKMHIFKYSRRHGTVADRMPGQLTEAEKHARSEVLMELDNRNHRAYMLQFIGEKQKILFERIIRVDNKDYLTGLTERYVEVAVPANSESASLVNQIAEVTVSGIFDENLLLGSLGGYDV